MASIVVDGPRAWATDVLDRKLGRALAALAGLKMFGAVLIIHPGPARLALAIGAVALVGWAVGLIPLPRPGPPPAAPAGTCPDPDVVERVAELERALFDLQAWGKTRAAHTQERLELITDMVAEVAAQVR